MRIMKIRRLTRERAEQLVAENREALELLNIVL